MKKNGMLRKLISVTTCMLMVVTVMPQTIALAYSEPDVEISGEYVDGQVIVSYVDTDDVDMTAREERTFNELIDDASEIMTLDATDETVALVESKDSSTEELIEEISQLPNVECVEPDYILHTEEMDAQSGKYDRNITDRQWMFTSKKWGINLKNWNVPDVINADGTVIAVMDTGIDYRNEDIDDVLWTDGEKYKNVIRGISGKVGTKYGICTDINTDERDTIDTFGHGTHCAGNIAAEWNDFGVSGCTSGSELMTVRVATGGKIQYSSVLYGYEYLREVKKAGVNLVAINNSWGGTGTCVAKEGYTGTFSTLRKAVDSMGELGVVSVFASGNYSSNTDVITYTTSALEGSPYKIVVDAIKSDGTLASYSNYGKATTDIAAPGTGIWSTYTTSDKYVGEDDIFGFRTLNGTSMAAPAVTGEVAIVYSHMENPTADEVVSAVLDGSRADGYLHNVCVTDRIADVEGALNQINLIDIGEGELQVEQSRQYTGSAIKPDCTVTLNGETLNPKTDYIVSYSDNKLPGMATVTVSGKGHYKGSLKGSFEIIPGGVSGFKATTASATKIKLSWNKNSAASGYRIYRQNDQTGEYKLIKTITKNKTLSYSNTGLTSGTKYTYAISAYYTVSGRTYFSDMSTEVSAVSNPAKVIWGSLTKGMDGMDYYVTANWNRKNCDGYEVRYAENKKFKDAEDKVIENPDVLTVKLTNRTKGKYTYVKIRAYCLSDNGIVYGAYSKTKKIKVK